MNLSWLLFYGRRLGMCKREVLITKYGEMMDMIACLAIFNGAAKPKKRKPKLTYMQVMQLR